jgi:hypothetical protein
MQLVRLALSLLFLYSAHTLRVSTSHMEDQEPNSVATLSTYSINGSITHAKTPNIVIFMTTHGKAAHLDLLRSCWPQLMRNRLPILSRADVIVHSNGNQNETELRQAMAGWPNKIARIAIASNPGYDPSSKQQLGAIQSMAEAVEKDYFKGYDWVIRINPDVILIRETGILSRMSSGYAGIFANCNTEPVQDGQGIDAYHVRVHTDFYAARTAFLIKANWVDYALWKETVNSKKEFRIKGRFNAESFASNVGFHNIMEQRLDSWMIHKGTGLCRVESKDMLHNHEHILEKCQKFVEDPASDYFEFTGHGGPEREIIFLGEEL